MPSEDKLTERQSQVLELHRKGKNPTEIGRELNISSQGVHGHLRRLANRGLIEVERPRNDRPVNPQDALAAIRATAEEQADAIRTRLSQIERDKVDLDSEADALQATLAEVEKVLA